MGQPTPQFIKAKRGEHFLESRCGPRAKGCWRALREEPYMTGWWRGISCFKERHRGGLQ